MLKEQATVKFHIFNFNFTPLKKDESTKNSAAILKACISKINEERIQNQKAIVIDRNENRDSESRQLFVSSAAYIAKDKVYKCRIALIRDNKIPTLVNRSNYTLTPFDKLGARSIAETTNFYINMDKATPVVCCEFNSHGPRISDIEYYFRYISSHNMLSISKACKASIHMKLPVNEVLESLRDVLKFRIKVKPTRLNYIYQDVEDSFITNMNALANSVSPNTIKVEASFREISDSDLKKNNRAILLMKKILNAIKEDNKVIDDFDDFYLEFEKHDGSDDVFNLMRGKQELNVLCPYKSPGNIDTKELYEKIKIKFSSYIREEKK